MVSRREGQSSMRVIVLKVMFIAVFILYTVHLFGLQVLRGEEHLLHAQNISRQTITVSPQRGEIYDRSYSQPLVTNKQSFTVSVIPVEVPRTQMPLVIERLASILSIDQALIERRLPPSVYNRYQSVEIASNVSMDTITLLAEQASSLPGVLWQSKPVRQYADIGSLSHIIGYIGNISGDELTVLFNDGYQPGDIIGKSGMERQYDRLLRGKAGQETRTIDARGKTIIGGDTRIPPEMGKNLVLTIDRRIQTLAERALGKRIGSVVVLRPSTGEVLAMVSYPWYNLGIFNSSDMGSEFNALINDTNRPLLNRSIQSGYPPASSFKILMTAAALAENAISPDRTIECRGEIRIGDRTFRCHVGRPGHGRVNLSQALALSCNIYYAVLGMEHLGVENIVNYSREFGFGSLTGIDLPNETSGFVPTPQWKERRFNERWMGGDTTNISIGQGDNLVTPLQMANMVAMVANGGTIYTPHILKEIRNPLTGTIEESIAPVVLHKSTIAGETFEQVRRDMRGVVTSGTVRYTPLHDITAAAIAGKTGTAEIGRNDRWHSWFAAFAPYQPASKDEQIVVSVIVEAANPWEWWAPFASAIIFQGVFANQTYEEAVQTLHIPEFRLGYGRRE